jgi:hypothetical protein
MYDRRNLRDLRIEIDRMLSTTRRVTASLFAFWFALYIGVPELVHPCPTHSAVAEQVGAGGHAHGAVAGHGSHGTPEPTEHTGECCCPDPQCGAQAVVPAAAVQLSESPRGVRSMQPSPTSGVQRPRIERLLPFATAPPFRPS